MAKTPDVPEKLLARHVQMHTSAAARNLEAALRPLRSRRTRYRGSPLFKYLEDAEKAAIIAEKEARKWGTRTTETGDLFTAAEGDG